MVAANSSEKNSDRLIRLMEDGLTSFLILEGVGQQEIRRIVGVDLKRVTHVSKQLKLTLKRRKQDTSK